MSSPLHTVQANMAALWILLVCLGAMFSPVTPQTSSSSPPSTVPPSPPPTNTTIFHPRVLKEGGSRGQEVEEEEGADDIEGSEAIDAAYEEQDNQYEMLPMPLAQDGSNEGYVRDYDGTYIVNDKAGIGCIMAYYKAKITIFYPDTSGEMQKLKVYPDDDKVGISGSCDRPGQESQLDVAWTSYILTLKFGQDDLTDSWFVSSFALTYDTADTQFDNAVTGLGKVTVSSEEGRKFWQTSNYKSFRCLLLHDVDLKDDLNNTAILHFDEVRVQAFCESSFFRRPKHCIHRVHRDEMVPVTVGGVLAGSTLLTVMFYGIFRYFKIKKVQYDTMQ